MLLQKVNGRVRLRFVPGAKGTRLAACEQQPPLRVIRSFPMKDGGALVHLHNVSGGVLAGDRLELSVEIERDGVAQLTSTGATRLYRRKKGAAVAVQSTSIKVGENAILEYLPDQLIPYSGSCYHQRTRIDLAEGAGLFWWESVAPGRDARGEVFLYELLEIHTDIVSNGKPIAIERMRLEPVRRPLSSIVRLGPYRYLSTFFVCKVGVEPARWTMLEAELGEIARGLSLSGRLLCGVSALRTHGLVVRALSVGGPEMGAGLITLWKASKRFLYSTEAVLPRKVY
jgi:urease accessory protein